LCHPLRDLGVTYTVHLLLVGKRVVDFLFALIELFSLALTVEALWTNIGGNCAVWKGVGHFERKFEGERGSSTNEFWRQKTWFPGAITWCCLRDPTFSRFDTIRSYRRVTQRHRHTHRRTHYDGYYPRRASSSRVKILKTKAAFARSDLCVYVLVYGTPPTNNAAIARSTNSARSYRRFLLRTRLRPLAALVVYGRRHISVIKMFPTCHITAGWKQQSPRCTQHNVVDAYVDVAFCVRCVRCHVMPVQCRHGDTPSRRTSSVHLAFNHAFLPKVVAE